jgi:glucosylglycerate synthase
LPEGSILSDDFLRELMNVGEVDILIGVPTFNDAKSVGQVVQAIRAGLLKHFPRQRAVIINADGGSTDGTPDLVRAASISDLQHASNLYALRTLHCISTQYSGGPATGIALHTILAAADLLRASVCAVVAPDSTTIEPQWMDSLLRPVTRDGFDLVTPLYRRHKFDGLLIRNLVYPMNRAIYCRRVREPYPPEFAFSGQLASHFLGQDFWSQDIGRSGAEIYFIISAIAESFRVSQSFLGPKSRVEAAAEDLVPAMRRSVGTLFWSLDQNVRVWSTNSHSEPIPTFGPEHEVSLEPIRVNRARLHEMFIRGVAELEPVLKSILSASTLATLQRAAGAAEGEFCYSNELWVRTVYEFAAAYHSSVISRDHIVQALAPLYRGKMHTFLVENRDASADEVESNIEALCLEFEHLKPSLLEMWNGRK